MDEEKFSVDLDMVHIPNFGTRRRRSMLPKPPQIQPGELADLEAGQASSSFESVIESETSTDGEDDVLSEVALRLIKSLSLSSVDLSDLPPLERARRRSMLAKLHGFGSRA